MRPRVFFVTSLTLLACTGAASAQQAAKPAAAPAQQGAKPAAEPNLEPYKIGPEDSLNITVWKNEAMTRTVQVRPDGMISMPLLDDVVAAGQTPMQLRDVLAKRLAEFIPNPDVSVIVTEVRSFKVSVLGEVSKPGRFDLKSWTTILDVIAQAGGFNQFAARSRIVVLRPAGKTMTRIPFNYNKMVSSGGGEEDNFYLQPGDIVLVP
jgi:polysaccharide export outer membrane protein